MKKWFVQLIEDFIHKHIIQKPNPANPKPCKNYPHSCEESNPPALYGGFCHCCADEISRGVRSKNGNILWLTQS